MTFHKALARLHGSAEFSNWRSAHPDHYLAHGFVMIDGESAPEWQIGFYDRKEDRISVFVLSDEIVQNPPSEVFKEQAKVKELDVKRVSGDIDDALTIASEYQQKNYKGHDPQRTIVLLQHLDRGQIWNISFITRTFSVCNIKIDAATHEVVHASCESLLGWGSAEPGERKR